jgi:membrane protein involved in colicin uptake
MQRIVKKVAIYSMVGLMQIGFGASIIEASPLHIDSYPVQEQYDRHDQRPDWHDRERFERERHERERIENQRHEREMRRRPHESRREWRERQHRENERHERELRMIRERWHL